METGKEVQTECGDENEDKTASHGQGSPQLNSQQRRNRRKRENRRKKRLKVRLENLRNCDKIQVAKKRY